MRALLLVLALAAIALGVTAGPVLAGVPETLPVLDRAQALVALAGCGGDAAQIALLPARCFVPAATLGYAGNATIWSPATRWYRFSAAEAQAPHRPWILVVSTYVTDGELAVVDRAGTVIAAQHFGSVIPVADRPVPSHEIRVPLPDPVPAGATLVVRLTSPISVPDTLQLQTVASIDADDRATTVGVGLAFAFLNGGALTMALFNVVLFVLLRRQIYLIYAAAIAVLVFYQVVETGTAWALLWPHLGLRDDYPSYLVWVVYVALIVAFARRMLNLHVVAPAIDRALLIVFGIVALDSVTYVTIPDVLWKIGVFVWLDPVVTALMLGSLVVAGIVAWRSKVSGAAAFTIAFAGSAVGLVAADIATYLPALGSTASLAYLPASYGIAWESIFLAAALGQRVRDAERDAARLSEFAFVDGLTGIANRRAFDSAIEREWSRVQRTGGMIAVAMFDIDHFKAFNDRFGHPAGDERLIAVARVIAASARRQGDVAARYGGEEFALLLPNTSLDAAFAIAESARQRVAEAGESDLTISAGVAVALATADRKTMQSLVVSADAALYAAKKSGRNRTERWNTLLGGTAAHAGGA
jgi:diguanylate cyclase (GGDEF)-like protein